MELEFNQENELNWHLDYFVSWAILVLNIRDSLTEKL